MILMAGILVYGETVLYQGGTTGMSTLNSEVRYIYCYDKSNAVADFTSDEFVIGNAVLDRIVVDANGTDTSFKLYLYDCTSTYNDALIWSKTDLTTASMPVSQAIVLSDGTSNHLGCPVAGTLKLVLADGDDATMKDLEVFIYYHRN